MMATLNCMAENEETQGKWHKVEQQEKVRDEVSRLQIMCLLCYPHQPKLVLLRIPGTQGIFKNLLTWKQGLDIQQYLFLNGSTWGFQLSQTASHFFCVFKTGTSF